MPAGFLPRRCANLPFFQVPGAEPASAAPRPDSCREPTPTPGDVAHLRCPAAFVRSSGAAKLRKKAINLYKLAAISLEVDVDAD
jgi:hypothetical protein